ncbi:MAG: VWA domain-containing protein [Bdellovibrionaceae bacterium]|nr:VWA domain-containing protein [Bdellovibrionales bacterium]MCB9254261.1 VWA domain-containing protein [Pseudobdellovibrionaceae bacterium]
MKTNTKQWLLGTLLVAATQVSVAQEVSLKWRYQEADTMNLVKGQTSVSYDAGADSINDSRIEKSLFAIELGNALSTSLKDFSETCKVEPIAEPPIRPLGVPGGLPILPPGPTPIPQPNKDCVAKRTAVADKLLASVASLQTKIDASREIQDPKFYEVLDLGRSLAKNMKEYKDRPVFKFNEGIARSFAAAPAGVGGGLNVTAGGAQDFGYFRKLVTDGEVPHFESLTMEGFLSEFDLSLTPQACDALLCVQPGLKVDTAAKKAFLQIGMNSNVQKATFHRKPLNLSIVLDISGSMSDTDNTEKSRLDWAKDAIAKTVAELNEQDILSIVLFDTNSEVLVPAANVTDKAALLKKVNALKTKGSTNLEAGLVDGYEQLSERALDLEGYESRLILISDAGLNTGVTDEAAVLKQITDYSNEGIGLTAIGLGLNFNQKFVHGITQSRGGNYLFVHSGKDMFRYFESFDFLVTPVAYNFKVALEFPGAKLVKAYGVPQNTDAPVQELINVQTLFFSEAGGAIVLEYDLN